MSRVNLGVVRDPNFSSNYAVNPLNPYSRKANYAKSSRPSTYVNKSSSAQKRRDIVGGVGGALSTIAGAAATSPALVAAYPAVAPVAVGLGIGYGVYKLGESFKLW